LDKNKERLEGLRRKLEAWRDVKPEMTLPKTV